MLCAHATIEPRVLDTQPSSRYVFTYLRVEHVIEMLNQHISYSAAMGAVCRLDI